MPPPTALWIPGRGLVNSPWCHWLPNHCLGFVNFFLKFHQNLFYWSIIHMSDFTFTFHFHALEKEMATHSSVLAWRIPGTGEPGGLPSMGLHRVGHDWSDLAAAAAFTCYKIHPFKVYNSAVFSIFTRLCNHHPFSSAPQSCPTLCDPMDCSMTGLPVHHQLPQLAQTHVHWVSDAIQLSHPLSSPSPPAFNLSQH